MAQEMPVYTCTEVREVQGMLYRRLMMETLTSDMLRNHKQYLDLDIKIESAHADLYINTCRHRHPLLSSYNTRENELLQACCSDNCLIGQRETNGTGISSKQDRMIAKLVFRNPIFWIVSAAEQAGMSLTCPQTRNSGACCEGCPKLSYFELCVYSSISFEDMVEEHAGLIESGYCSCNQSKERKTKLVGFRLIHRMVAKDKNVPFLEVLHELNCGMNVCTLYFKDTPILIAITQNRIETINFLVQHGADVNGNDGSLNHIAPLFLAMQLNLKHVVQILLSSENIDVNARCTSMNAKDPLLSKFISIAPACVELLLEAGADPNIVDDQNATPLTWCAYCRNGELIKLLIRYGADVNKGESLPLLIAVHKGIIAMAEVLLEAGADPNHCDKRGDFPILLAAGTGFVDILKLLIKFRGKVDFVNQFGFSAIHMAAFGGHSEVLTILLKHGLPHDTQTKFKQTPLSLAAQNNHTDVMKILLPLGCNVNNTGRDGDTPIHHFAMCNKVSVEGVQLLLRFGADPDILNDYGCSALWRAVYWEQIALLKELIAANVKLDVPTCGMIRHLRNRSSKIIYDTPKTPLYLAIDKGNLEIGMLLVRAGCNIHKERWILDRHDIPTDENNLKVLAKLVQCVQTPFRLSEICRNYLRQLLGHNIHEKVTELSLPQVLKDYLTLKDLLSEY